MKKNSDDIKNKALAYLASIGAHLTSQRKIIVEKAFTPPAHYTAEELLSRSRKADRSISRATIYRTLAVLVESGLLHELALDKKSSAKRYDFNYVASPDHNHIICADCGKVFEFDDPQISARKNTILAKLGFKPKSVLFRIEVSCLKFAAGKCPNRISKHLKSKN